MTRLGRSCGGLTSGGGPLILSSLITSGATEVDMVALARDAIGLLGVDNIGLSDTGP